jgi:hypothetical protein
LKTEYEQNEKPEPNYTRQGRKRRSTAIMITKNKKNTDPKVEKRKRKTQSQPKQNPVRQRRRNGNVIGERLDLISLTDCSGFDFFCFF